MSRHLPTGKGWTVAQGGRQVEGIGLGGETVVMPRAATVRRRSGLVRARMTDPDGVQLYRGWIPSGARIVTRGSRVFIHRQSDEWRQVRVVQLGDDGYPL